MADSVSVADLHRRLLTEIQGGDGLSLSAAGRMFPGHRGGASVDPSTVFRWITRGTRSPPGQIVRLEAVRVGGRWLTSRAAVARFVAALTAATTSPPAGAPSAVRTPTDRQRASERAAEQLKKMGA